MASNIFHSGPGIMQHLQEPEDMPDNLFFPKLGMKVGKVVKYSLLARFAISIALSKGKLTAVLRNYQSILRFSLATSLFTLIYHLTRRLIRHLKRHKIRDISRDFEIALATGLASLGLTAAAPGDLKLFKFILYQRLTLAVFRMLGTETGLFRPIQTEHGHEKRRLTVESVVAITTVTFISYCFVFEAQILGKSLMRTFLRGAGLNSQELMFFDTVRAINELKQRDGMAQIIATPL